LASPRSHVVVPWGGRKKPRDRAYAELEASILSEVARDRSVWPLCGYPVGLTLALLLVVNVGCLHEHTSVLYFLFRGKVRPRGGGGGWAPRRG